MKKDTWVEILPMTFGLSDLLWARPLGLSEQHIVGASEMILNNNGGKRLWAGKCGRQERYRKSRPHPSLPALRPPPLKGAREPVGGHGAGPPAAASSARSRNSTMGVCRARRQARPASATAATAATATQALRFVIATDLCAACLPALRPCRRARRVPDFSIRL